MNIGGAVGGGGSEEAGEAEEVLGAVACGRGGSSTVASTQGR
jgi:hypothetical protein